MESILQALMIAGITSASTAFVSLKVLQIKFDELNKRFIDLETTIHEISKDYVRKEEFEKLRIRLHDCWDWISGQKAIADLKKIRE